MQRYEKVENKELTYNFFYYLCRRIIINKVHMIQSMTGYGKAVVAYEEKKIHVEVKSLNSKQLDLNTRIAPLYREKEMEMRQMVAEALIRGKVDMSVWIEKDMVADPTPINAALVENYYQQIKDISVGAGRRTEMRRAGSSLPDRTGSDPDDI